MNGGRCPSHDAVLRGQPERFVPRAMVEHEPSEITVSTLLRRAGKRRSPIA
jgi:hypothetical protein